MSDEFWAAVKRISDHQRTLDPELRKLAVVDKGEFHADRLLTKEEIRKILKLAK